MLDLCGIDLDEIATALADQTDYEHRWLLDPRTGQVAFWTSDTGTDGQNPVGIDELDLIPIDPIPSYVWYQDMADFAQGISDGAARRRLTAALQGRGSFRRFKNQLYEHLPELISPWLGTPCVTPEPGDAPSSGSWSKAASSTRTPPRSPWPSIRNPIYPDASTAGDRCLPTKVSQLRRLWTRPGDRYRTSADSVQTDATSQGPDVPRSVVARSATPASVWMAIQLS